MTGTTANGLDVDVTRVQGTVTIAGATTPADAFANPTTALTEWARGGVFNGTTWDRRRSATADALASTGLAASGNYGFNGTTWDRVKTTGGNLQVQTTTSSALATGQVTVDNTTPVIKVANTSRKSIMLRNIGATDAYIGPTGVTTSTGFLIKATESITLDRTTAAVYGVTVGAGTTTFAYLEE